jgi:hypothetical protein
MNESENFFSSFFEPEATDETYQTEYHEEERPINETPEKVKIETDEVDSYPEKCLWDNIGFPETNTDPDTTSEESDIEEIQSETNKFRILQNFCHIDTQGIDPPSEEQREESKLSVGCLDRSKYFCLPLKQEPDNEEIQSHTDFPQNKCFLFYFYTPESFSKSEFEMIPDDIENGVNDCQSTKRDDISKGDGEEKPDEKKSPRITLEIVELAIEGKWCPDEEYSEEYQTLAEDREVFLHFWEIVPAHKWDDRKECDEDELRDVTERLPITGKEEDEPGTQEESSEYWNNEGKSSRTRVWFFWFDISEHRGMLLLGDDTSREPTIEESMDIHRRIIPSSFLMSKNKERLALRLFHKRNYPISDRGEECFYSDLEHYVRQEQVDKIDIPHSAEKCYETENCTIKCLPDNGRTNRSHPEPFFTSYLADSEERPRIGKRASEISKNTSEGDARDESENSFIASLILPESRSRENLDDVENGSIQNNTTKSQEDDLSRDFPTIDLSKYITEYIGKWEENSPRIQCQTSKLSHLGRCDIWDDQDDTKECHESCKSKWVHGAIVFYIKLSQINDSSPTPRVRRVRHVWW